MSLNIVERHGWSGRYRVTRLDPITHAPIDEPLLWTPNLITYAAKTRAARLLRDSGTDIRIRYVALGNGDTAAAPEDVDLESEVFRKQPTQQTATATGECTTTVIVSSFEAVQQIEEIGWFAGPDAVATADTGLLVARVLYSRNHTSDEALQIDREDLFS